MPWLRSGDGGCVLRVRVIPGAKRDGLAGIHDDALKVRIAAPPVDGAANDRLIKFLARKVLGIPRTQIWIIRGTTARLKDLAIARPVQEVAQGLVAAGIEFNIDAGSL